MCYLPIQIPRTTAWPECLIFHDLPQNPVHLPLAGPSRGSVRAVEFIDTRCSWPPGHRQLHLPSFATSTLSLQAPTLFSGHNFAPSKHHTFILSTRSFTPSPRTHSFQRQETEDDNLRTPSTPQLPPQAIPNILHGILELIKAWYGVDRCYQGSQLIRGISVLVIMLCFAPPIVYATANRSDPWTQVATMILSMSTAVFVISAGYFGAMEAARRK